MITSLNEFKKQLNKSITEKLNDSSIDYAGIADPNFVATPSNYDSLAKWPDGEYKGFIKGYEVYSNAIDSGFRATTGYRNMFPIMCMIVVKDGHAVVYSKGGILFSDKEIEDKWRAEFGRGHDGMMKDPNFEKFKDIK